MFALSSRFSPGALAAAQQESPGFAQDIALAWQIGADRSAADAALERVIEKDADVAPYRSPGSMRCGTMRARPLRGSTGPGPAAIRGSDTCSTTPSSAAVRG